MGTHRRAIIGFAMSVFSELPEILRSRVLVIGDVILDRYITGAAERVSPEAAVIVLRAESDEVRLGGAASVAALLRGLEADVVLAGVVGDDSAAATVRKLCQEEGIDVSLLMTDGSRQTTIKERFLGSAWQRPGQQMLRVDHESREPLKERIAAEFAERVIARLADVSVVLTSDYGKGVCTDTLLAPLIAAANRAGIPVLVDPAHGAPLERYRGAQLIKANRIEAELLSGQQRIVTAQDALQAAARIREQGHFDAVVVTLDQDGCVLSRSDGTSRVFATSARSVCDVTGAGDMFLAVLGFCAAAEIDLSEALPLANVAAGLEVQRLGVSVITRNELLAALSPKQGEEFDKEKIVTDDQAARLAEQHRRDGRRIVFTNGCFDLLHAGHVRCLQDAARLGDILIVAINSDASVRKLKGPTRPVYSQDDRAALLAALSCVSHVLIFDDDTPHRLLHLLRPDVLAKGGTTGHIVGCEVVESYGGGVLHLPQYGQSSTTNTVQRIQRLDELHANAVFQLAESDHEPVSTI